MFHGIALLLGTVTVSIGFLAGLMYLVQSYALKHSRSSANRLRLPSLEWLERVNGRTLGLSAVLIAFGFASGLVLNLSTHRGDAKYHCGQIPSSSASPPCSCGSSPQKCFGLFIRPPAADAKSPTSRSPLLCSL